MAAISIPIPIKYVKGSTELTTTFNIEVDDYGIDWTADPEFVFTSAGFYIGQLHEGKSYKKFYKENAGPAIIGWMVGSASPMIPDCGPLIMSTIESAAVWRVESWSSNSPDDITTTVKGPTQFTIDNRTWWCSSSTIVGRASSNLVEQNVPTAPNNDMRSSTRKRGYEKLRTEANVQYI